MDIPIQGTKLLFKTEVLASPAPECQFWLLVPGTADLSWETPWIKPAAFAQGYTPSQEVLCRHRLPVALTSLGYHLSSLLLSNRERPRDWVKCFPNRLSLYLVQLPFSPNGEFSRALPHKSSYISISTRVCFWRL